MPSMIALAPWQMAAIFNPFTHFAMYAGIAAGKTTTGSHFVLYHLFHHPHMTGLIGANTHDQLSQASLKELFRWLDEYGLEYVINRKPPPSWKTAVAKLKTYNNTMHILNPVNGKAMLVFTRVTSKPENLRGITISWYWLDETRDTVLKTHDVILARMRETPGYMKGLITTTTNGEDWSFDRFMKPKTKKDAMTFGSMHVPTYSAVEAGFIDDDFYQVLRGTYSDLFAQQELDALHVNVEGGKAYYAGGDHNRMKVAPWGDTVPNRERPLIIGCDFNFQPAPMIWMVGQVGPNVYGPTGALFSDHMHWFGELHDVQISTQEMTLKLLQQYPDFFYEIYGDQSGGMGTTSNAGVTDYDQMAMVLGDAYADYSISRHQQDAEEAKSNPRVKTRVENMNRLMKNALGEIRMSWNPQACSHFDSDIKQVGWKMDNQNGRGKLDDGGNKKLTHATDGAGYAMFKIFPPESRARIIDSIPSQTRKSYGLVGERVLSW